MQRHIWKFDGGLNLKDEPHLIGDNQAIWLKNCVLESGAISGQRGVSAENSTVLGVNSIYKLNDGSWLRYTDKRTIIPWKNTVIESMDEGGTATNNGRPKIYDRTLATEKDLGITGPHYGDMAATTVRETIQWAVLLDAKQFWCFDDGTGGTKGTITEWTNQVNSDGRVPITGNSKWNGPDPYASGADVPLIKNIALGDFPIFFSKHNFQSTDAAPFTDNFYVAFKSKDASGNPIDPPSGIMIDIAQSLAGTPDVTMSLQYVNWAEITSAGKFIKDSTGKYVPFSGMGLNIIADTSDNLTKAGLHYIAWKDEPKWTVCQKTGGGTGDLVFNGSSGYLLRIMVTATNNLGRCWANRITPAPSGVDASEITNRIQMGGKYKYLVTYGVTSNGLESHPGGPGDMVIDVAVQSDESGFSYISLTNIPTPTTDDYKNYRTREYTIDTKYLYRTTLNGEDFYRLATIDEADNDYTDKIPDSDLVLNEPLTTEDKRAPHTSGVDLYMEHICYHAGRFWGTFCSRNSSVHELHRKRLFYSWTEDPHSWGYYNYIEFDDEILAHYPVAGEMLVITRKGPHVVTGSDPAYLSTYKLMGNYTISNFHTLRVNDKFCIWVAPDGICTYHPAQGLREILTPLIGTQNIVESALHTIITAELKHDEYYCFYPDVDMTCFVLDFRYGDVRIRTLGKFPLKSSGTDKLSSTFLDPYSKLDDGTYQERMYVGIGTAATSYTQGMIWEYGTADTANPADDLMGWVYRTGEFSGYAENILSKVKLFDRVEIIHSGTLDVGLIVDGKNYLRDEVSGGRRKEWLNTGEGLIGQPISVNTGINDRIRSVIFFPPMQLGHGCQIQMMSGDSDSGSHPGFNGIGIVYEAYLYYDVLENFNKRQIMRYWDVMHADPDPNADEMGIASVVKIDLYVDGAQKGSSWSIYGSGKKQICYPPMSIGYVPQIRWDDPPEAGNRMVVDVIPHTEDENNYRETKVYHRVRIEHEASCDILLSLDGTTHRSTSLSGAGVSHVFFLPNYRGQIPHLVWYDTAVDYKGVQAINKIDWVSDSEDVWTKRKIYHGVRVAHKEDNYVRLYLDGTVHQNVIQVVGHGTSHVFFQPNSMGLLPQIHWWGGASYYSSPNDHITNYEWISSELEEFSKRIVPHYVRVSHKEDCTAHLYFDGTEHREYSLEGTGETDIFFEPNKRGKLPQLQWHNLNDTTIANDNVTNVQFFVEPEEQFMNLLLIRGAWITYEGELLLLIWVDGKIMRERFIGKPKKRIDTEYVKLPSGTRGYICQVQYRYLDSDTNDSGWVHSVVLDAGPIL